MFVTNFKQMLKTLPNNNHDSEDAHDAFMAHISDNDTVVAPTNEFMTRVTNYSMKKINAPVSSTISTTLNPKIVLAAFAMTRFPIETLRTPEKPIQLTLLNKAMNLLQSIQAILREHSPAEDDTADDFLPHATAAHFIGTLGEYRAAWAVWWQSECEEMRAEIAAWEATMAAVDALSDNGPELIFGEE